MEVYVSMTGSFIPPMATISANYEAEAYYKTVRLKLSSLDSPLSDSVDTDPLLICRLNSLFCGSSETCKL